MHPKLNLALNYNGGISEQSLLLLGEHELKYFLDENVE